MTEFEQNARQQLANYGSAVDTERLWTKIELDLQGDKRRQKLFWFWLFGLVLLVAGGAFWRLKQPADVPAAAPQALPVVPAAAIARTEKQDVKTPLPAVGDARGRAASPLTIGLAQVQYVAPNLTYTGPAGRYLCRKGPVLTLRRPSGPLSWVQIETRCRPAGPAPSWGLHTELGLRPRRGQTFVESGDYQIGRVSERPVPIARGQNVLAHTTGSPLPTVEPVAFEKASFAAQRQDIRTPLLEKIEILAPLPTLAQPLEFAPRALNTPAALSKTDCPKWRKNRGIHPYFGLYGGAQYPIKSLTAKTAEFEDLAQRRTETETVLEGVAVGGYLGLKHWSGLLAEGGLEYNRINERFDLKSVTTDTIGRIGITGIIVNAPGDTTFIQDSIFVVEETRSVKKTFNHYQFLQIPVAIGYEWLKNDRWTMYVKAGVAINIRFRQKAEIINPAGVPEKYTSGNTRPDYPFRSKVGLTPFINLGARYRLLNGLSVFGELRYLHRGSSITTDLYPLQQRYGLPGANLGVHVQF